LLLGFASCHLSSRVAQFLAAAPIYEKAKAQEAPPSLPPSLPPSPNQKIAIPACSHSCRQPGPTTEIHTHTHITKQNNTHTTHTSFHEIETPSFPPSLPPSLALSPPLQPYYNQTRNAFVSCCCCCCCCCCCYSIFFVMQISSCFGSHKTEGRGREGGREGRRRRDAGVLVSDLHSARSLLVLPYHIVQFCSAARGGGWWCCCSSPPPLPPPFPPSLPHA